MIRGGAPRPRVLDVGVQDRIVEAIRLLGPCRLSAICDHVGMIRVVADLSELIKAGRVVRSEGVYSLPEEAL